jgi:hypothetical protein
MTIDPADRVPTADRKSVTFSFTTQTALAYGDGVTISYPPGFFSGSSLRISQANSTFLSCCNPQLRAGDYNMSFSVGSSGAPPAAYTITITGLVMGHATAGSANGIVVSTTNDRASAGAPTGVLGGRVQGVSLRIRDEDLIPGASNKRITG